MLFESLEARRLMSVVAGNPSSLYGITATQSGSGTLTVKGVIANAQMSVIEAGTRNDPGFISFYGAGDVAVIDATGNAVVFNNLSSKPISIGGTGSGNQVLFDGNTHIANMNLGGGPDLAILIDEGAGGSVIQCGGQTNNVFVPFSHKVTINDGGGTNNIFINTDFNADTVISGSTVMQTDWSESVILGNTTADLSTVQVGGGNNLIVDFAGNLKMQAGGGYNVLAIQGETGTITNPPKTFSTPWVDVISQQGIDLVEGT